MAMRSSDAQVVGVGDVAHFDAVRTSAVTGPGGAHDEHGVAGQLPAARRDRSGSGHTESSSAGGRWRRRRTRRCVSSTGSSALVTGRSSTAMLLYATGPPLSTSDHVVVARAGGRAGRTPWRAATSAWLNTKRRSTESSIGSCAPHPVAALPAMRRSSSQLRSRRYLRISALVLLSCASSGSAASPSSSGMIARGELLAQLDAPLVERVDVPDRALREHLVLVDRDELAERVRREPLGEDRVGRVVALRSRAVRLAPSAHLGSACRTRALRSARTSWP